MPSRTAKYRVRRLLRRTGWDLVRFRGELEDVQRTLLRRLRIDTVLDIGANEGQYSQRIRQLGYDGLIVAFEPLDAAFRKLAINFSDDGNFLPRRLAIGDQDGPLEINLSGNGMSSSLLSMASAHELADPKSRYIGKELVECARLDTYDPPGANLWMKMDVQGAEGQILDGASATLRRVQAIQLELSLVELYEGAPLVEQMLRRLREAGFAPVFLGGGFQDPHDGEMLQAEGLFRRASRVGGR